MNDDYANNMMRGLVESLKNGDTGWQQLALCAETDPDAFFPEEGGSQRIPKNICKDCPVRVRCLEYAIRNNETHGVWGGLSPSERQKLRLQQFGSKRLGRPKKEAANAELTS